MSRLRGWILMIRRLGCWLRIDTFIFFLLTSEIISLPRIYVEGSFNVEFCSLEYVSGMNYLKLLYGSELTN
jgi:hypothetical protein